MVIVRLIASHCYNKEQSNIEYNRQGKSITCSNDCLCTAVYKLGYYRIIGIEWYQSR